MAEIDGLEETDREKAVMSGAERMVTEFARSRMRTAQVTEDPVRGGELAPERVMAAWHLLWRQIKRHGLDGKVRLAVRKGSLYLVRRQR